MPLGAARRSFRRAAALSATLLVVAACSGDHDSASTTAPTVSPAAVETTSSTLGLATTSTSTVSSTAATTSTSTATSTTTGSAVPTTGDASTVSTVELDNLLDFEPPVTDDRDVLMLGIYLNFMSAQDEALLNPSDPDRRAQLAAITTSEEFAALEVALDDLLARGGSYRIIEPATYHPFVEYGDAYRDGFRTVADCFTMASARVDSAGNPFPGETLARQSSGYVVEFVVRDGQWLASASYYDPAICLLG